MLNNTMPSDSMLCVVMLSVVAAVETVAKIMKTGGVAVSRNRHRLKSFFLISFFENNLENIRISLRFD